MGQWGNNQRPIKRNNFENIKNGYLKKTSWHYHSQKESYFYIFSGEVSIHISDGDDLNLAHIELLKQGDCFFVGANKRHMITAMKASVLLESSNYDDPVDKTIIHY